MRVQTTLKARGVCDTTHQSRAKCQQWCRNLEVAAGLLAFTLENELAGADASVEKAVGEVDMQCVVLALDHVIVTFEEHVVKQKQGAQNSRLVLRRDGRISELQGVEVTVRKELPHCTRQVTGTAFGDDGHLAHRSIDGAGGKSGVAAEFTAATKAHRTSDGVSTHDLFNAHARIAHVHIHGRCAPPSKHRLRDVANNLLLRKSRWQTTNLKPACFSRATRYHNHFIEATSLTSTTAHTFVGSRVLPTVWNMIINPITASACLRALAACASVAVSNCCHHCRGIAVRLNVTVVDVLELLAIKFTARAERRAKGLDFQVVIFWAAACWPWLSLPALNFQFKRVAWGAAAPAAIIRYLLNTEKLGGVHGVTKFRCARVHSIRVRLFDAASGQELFQFHVLADSEIVGGGKHTDCFWS